MAIPDNYIDKITKEGDSRMISPAANMVRVNNENFEGSDLDVVLDEVSAAIDEAGSGGYAPPPGGIPATDLAPAVQTSLDKADSAYQKPASGIPASDIESGAIPDVSGLATKTEVNTGLAGKVDKETGKSLMTDAEHTKLQNLPTAAELEQALANAGADVSVTTNQDGTFTIHVGDDDYTVNLNHTHENMAKLVVCEESDLPSTLANDTIYAITDSGETEIEKLIIRGMEFVGGGVPDTGEPMISSPSNGSTINLGTNEGSGVSKTITVKGKNLTGDLTVAVGTGLTISYGQSTGQSSVTIPMAQALLGAQVTIAYSGSGALADGSLLISHGNDVLSSVVVVVEAPVDLEAVKLTGTQWLQTDYCPNENTQIEMTCMFSSNSNTGASGYNGLTFIYAKTDSGKFYRMYHNTQGTGLIHVPQTGTAILNVTSANLGTPNSVINIDNVAGSFSFAPGGSNPSSKTFTKRTATSPYALEIGRGTYDSSAAPDTTLYGAYDLVIYSLVIKEAGTVVRNYQPKSLNGVPGLYDTINDNFISSETSDELVAIQNS